MVAQGLAGSYASEVLSSAAPVPPPPPGSLFGPGRNSRPEMVRPGETEETQTLRGPPSAAPTGAACVSCSPSLANSADAGAASSLHPHVKKRKGLSHFRGCHMKDGVNLFKSLAYPPANY